MGIYTVRLQNVTGPDVVSLSDGTTYAALEVSAGRGPTGNGWTGVSYDTETGRFTFTSNDGIGYVSDDITVDLDAAVAAAEAAQTGAESAEAATEALFDQFGDQYLGPKASDPTVDNDGDPLTQGDIYFNTTDSVLKFYSGSAWVAPESIATTAATAAQAAQSAAEAAQTAAETAQAGAETAETNAASSETTSAASAAAAAGSAAAASTSADEAAASAASINPDSIDINGGTIDGTVIGGSTPAAGSFTTGSFTGNVSFGDNDKAIFGAGSDLQIYHDTSASYISDQGSGPLNVLGSQVNIYNAVEDTQFASWNASAAKTYIDGSLVTNTTATGIDVTGTIIADSANITGTVTADGLTVESNSAPTVTIRNTRSDSNWDVDPVFGSIDFYSNDGSGGGTGVISSIQSISPTATGAASNLTFNVATGSANNVEAMRIDASGNLLVGKTALSDTTVGISLESNGRFKAIRDSNSGYFGRLSTDGPIVNFAKDGSTVGSIGVVASDRLYLATDDSGNSGLAFDGDNSRIYACTSTGDTSDSTTDLGSGTQRFKDLYLSGGVSNPSGSLTFDTTGGEAMRIDASGNILVATTSVSGPDNGLGGTTFDLASFDRAVLEMGHSDTSTAQRTMINFYSGSGSGRVGFVACNNTTTSYNTSSDYRLKEDVQPMTGASDRVQSLKPCNFAWKADGTRVDGFLAHEAQAVVPEAVTGEKDGEEMQAIDQSKLVPLLTAALQEALTKIDALETRITTLEG